MSELAGDPSMAAIIDQFVAGLPEQVTRMRNAFGGGCHEDLRRGAHQLKGAAGGYGYSSLTEKAQVLQKAAEAGDPEAEGLALREVQELTESIVRGRSQLAPAQEGQP